MKYPAMHHKICLVTGANAGIGKATALGLAQLGATVVMVSRDPLRGQKALEEIVEKSGNTRIDLFNTDLASLASVKELAKTYLAKYDKLHVLINNAGIYFTKCYMTKDNIEMQFCVNHLAPFLLTNLLLDTLKQSAPSRIINVSSGAHFSGKINFDNLYFQKKYSGVQAYSQSKLANVFFTYELDRRLKGTEVTANCLHPGVVRTDIGDKHSSGFTKYLWKLWKPFMISTESGAQTSIYLAASELVEAMSGKYFEKCQPIPSSSLSNDQMVAKKLWEVSEKLVGLSL